jgi:hypothetical protein
MPICYASIVRRVGDLLIFKVYPYYRWPKGLIPITLAIHGPLPSCPFHPKWPGGNSLMGLSVFHSLRHWHLGLGFFGDADFRGSAF